jgi:gluconolactonase
MSQEQIAEGLAWPEGPAVMPDGSVIFVESYRSQLTRWSAEGTQRFSDTAGAPNAAALGSDGCLYVTQNGGVIGPWVAEVRTAPSIQRVRPDGTVEVVATHVAGYELRAPNDLAFGPDGRLYFTDPGGAYDPVNRPETGRIFVLNEDGTGELLADLPAVYPNGIVVEADGSVVWVESYTRAVRRIAPNGGVIEDICVLPEAGVPDGLAVAENGDLYITGTKNAGVEVVSSSGEYLAFLSVGAVPTNCAFAGSTLYVTDGGHTGLGDAEYAGTLWALQVDVEGMPVFTGTIESANG